MIWLAFERESKKRVETIKGVGDKHSSTMEQKNYENRKKKHKE